MARQSEDLEVETTPLLNEYKHALFKRRILQTFTGGLKLRKAPWYILVIQLALWIAPLPVCAPFIVLEALDIWNQYYLAIVYGSVVGLAVLALSIAVFCVRHNTTPVVEVGSVGPQLDDEMSIDFSSCFGLETLDVIFATKRIHSLLIHPLVSGLISFAGCFMLFPRILQEVMPIGGVVVVFILGWFTLCNALYSLSVGPPPETATYRPIDFLGIKFLMRPFYILAVAALFFPVRLLVSEPALYLQLLYTVLCLLPVGWLVGVLPPLDALIPWFMELTLTWFMGGSPMATDLRVSIMFTLSLASTTIIAVLTRHTIAVLLATASGFLLSQDIFTNLKALAHLLSTKCSRTHWPPSSGVFSKTYSSYHILDFHPVSDAKVYLTGLVTDTCTGALVLAAGLTTVYFTFRASEDSDSLARTVIANVLIALYFVFSVSNNLQGVYLLGAFRNPLYPWDCESVAQFKQKRRLLNYFSIPRKVVVSYASPLLMVAYVGLSLETRDTVVPHIWFGITASRILRKIWQNTSSAHLELTLVAILHLALPSDNGWSILGLGTQSLIVGVAMDIATDYLKKVWFAATQLITFITDKKQKRIFISVGSILFLPLSLLILLISSILSAPILPLFTLPIFFVAFPRTQRFWPSLINYGSSYTKCEDTVYYQQAEKEIVKALSVCISSGAIHIQPGAHLLLRFQDRLAIATVLEVGFGFSTVIFRGLELQETSCHTIEATRIDEIFESGYNPKSKSCLEFWLNTHILNTLQPVGSAVVCTYSDARNVLTGVIDQPLALERFSLNLLKCLTWVLFHHIYVHKKEEERKHNDTKSQPQNPDSGFYGSFPTSKHLEDNVTNTKEMISSLKHRLGSPDTFSWSGSIPSIEDLTSSPNPPSFSPFGAGLPGLIPEDRPLDTNPLDNEIGQSELRLSRTAVLSTQRGSGVFNGIRQEALEGPIPTKWMDLPLQYTQISKLLRDFPYEWFNHIKESTKSSYGSPEIEQHFAKLVMVCFSLVDVPCSNKLYRREAKTKPFDIYDGFCGNFPFSTHQDWLTHDEQLHNLVLKAFRYAVKLVYDEISLGETESHSELEEYLQDYDRNCFIGRESEPGWEEGILMQKPHLFSLGRDPEKNVYTAHVLTLQEEVVHIGQLNSRGVHAIWADLAFELLYLTNDDEERYSIQAHPALLRNLTIQAADPPLGYSVHSSGIVRMPCV